MSVVTRRSVMVASAPRALARHGSALDAGKLADPAPTPGLANAATAH